MISTAVTIVLIAVAAFVVYSNSKNLKTEAAQIEHAISRRSIAYKAALRTVLQFRLASVIAKAESEAAKDGADASAIVAKIKAEIGKIL